MNLLALAWLTEIGIMQYRAATKGRPDAAGGGKILWPSDLVASFVIYGGLSIVAEVSDDAGRFAAAFGWVLVLATTLNLVDPTGQGSANEAQLTAQATGGATPATQYASGGTSTQGGPPFGFGGLPITTTPGGARAQ